jgi:hypothetical protein
MKRSRRHPAVVYALYVNAAVLVAILVAILAKSDSAPSLLPAAYAQQQPPIAGGGGVFIMPAQFSVNTWGCYLLDIDAQTVVAYQFYPGDRQLRFVAARNYRYDRRMANYNTTPAPAEIKDLVEKEMNANRVMEQNNAQVSPEAPKPQK